MGVLCFPNSFDGVVQLVDTTGSSRFETHITCCIFIERKYVLSLNHLNLCVMIYAILNLMHVYLYGRWDLVSVMALEVSLK